MRGLYTKTFFTSWKTLGATFKSCLMQLSDECLNSEGDYDEDLKDAVLTWLNSQVVIWYDEGIHKLVPRYDKSLNVKGDYVEK